MATLTLKMEDGDRRIGFTPGQSLREILDATSFRVRSGCNGTGACGLCRVRIRAGDVEEPTQTERLYLSPDQIASGVRLACQVRPKGSMEVMILDRAPLSAWRAIAPASRSLLRPEGRLALPLTVPSLPGDVRTPYGVAVDLGTTHVSLSFYDLLTGKWLTGRHGLNPQAQHGTDVMTRLTAACESDRLARILREHAIDAIREGIADVTTREGIGAEQVVRLVLAGNTTMLALLSGRNYPLLLQPAYWTRTIDCLPESPGELSADLGIHPLADVTVLPPLAGFVGSDLLAGVLATKLTDTAGSLLIDFGTNSEIALWDGNLLWVTAAAGGPAFEGSGISCGMAGEPGAIQQLWERHDVESPGFGFTTIDDEKPRGLCGSGIVDLMAHLVRSGKLTSIGRFTQDVPHDGYLLLEGEPGLVLTKRDVDIFQRAKAAIIAAVRVLLSMARMSPGGLRRIYIGGVFGYFLNLQNAMSIGLLPEMAHEAVRLCGNTALAGCEELLISPDPSEAVRNLTEMARIVNLSQCPDFADFFLEGLYLRKWP